MPKRLRSKLDQKWRYGCFVGRSLGSDQNHVALSDGSIIRARALVRLVPERRWDSDWLMRVRMTPLTEHTKFLDQIEEQHEPHEHKPEDRPDEHDVPEPPARRRVRITLSDLY